MSPVYVFDVLKGLVGLATSIGVGTIINNVVQSTTPMQIGKGSKFFITIGSFVLSGMVSTMAATHIESVIDGSVEALGLTKTEETVT